MRTTARFATTRPSPVETSLTPAHLAIVRRSSTRAESPGHPDSMANQVAPTGPGLGHDFGRVGVLSGVKSAIDQSGDCFEGVRLSAANLAMSAQNSTLDAGDVVDRRAREETVPSGDDEETPSDPDRAAERPASSGAEHSLASVAIYRPESIPTSPGQYGVRTILRPAAAPRTYLDTPPPIDGLSARAYAVVAPGGAPAVNNNAGSNDCLPSTASAVLSWDVVSADATNWGVDVTGLALAGQINIKPWPSDPGNMVVPNTPNPVDGGNINNTAGSANRWQAAIDDMADYDTAGGGAGPNWHSTGASRAHEWAHWNGDYVGDAVTSASGGNWPKANTNLDALREPKASSATAADARTALQPRVNARLATWRTATIGRWNTLISTTDSPGSGGRGYAAGLAVLNGHIAAVRAYATGKGWTGAPP